MTALRTGIHIGAAGAAVAFAALWLVEPRADPWAQPLSAYALTDSKSLWQLCVVITAITVSLVGQLPFAADGSIERRALTTTSVGLLAVALVPTDPWFPWEKLPTVPGAFHVLASAVAMTGFGLFALAFLRRERASVARILPALYIASLTVTVGTVLVLIALGRSPGFIGLAEWILLGLALACCAAAPSSETARLTEADR